MLAYTQSASRTSPRPTIQVTCQVKTTPGTSQSSSRYAPRLPLPHVASHPHHQRLAVRVERLSNRSIDFDLVGVDASIANAFRRILIAEVPTVCIERVYIWCNTSVIADEVLAHRLGLVPLNVDPAFLDMKDREPLALYRRPSSHLPVSQPKMIKRQIETRSCSGSRSPVSAEKTRRGTRRIPRRSSSIPRSSLLSSSGFPRASRGRSWPQTYPHRRTQTSSLQNCVRDKKSTWRCMPSKASVKTTPSSLLSVCRDDPPPHSS